MSVAFQPDATHQASPLLQAIATAAAVHDRSGTVAKASLAALHQAGITTLTVPTALGGSGAGLYLAAQAVREVGAACPGTALILAMQLSKQVALAANPDWPVELREQLGRQAVRHGALINAARAEPELGSPTNGGLPATIARRTAEGWVLSGHKRYVTGLPALRFIEILARTDEVQPRIGSFLVEADAPGLEILPAWNHLGLRASGSEDLRLHEVEVPEARAIGLKPAAQWRPGNPTQAAWNAALIGAVYVGVADAALAWVRGFLHARRPGALGAPLSSLPQVRQSVGRAAAQLVAAGRLLDSLGRDVDAGHAPAAVESGALKALLAEAAIRAVEVAVSLAGNHALDRANPLERHWRDVQCARVHVPTEDAAHAALGAAFLQQEGSPT